jgi:hypothetical protein
MPSELKSETARTNGAKSHGPTTAAGKEASSRNAIKHGFTACNTYILECESKEEFQEFWAEHIAIHLPVAAPEKELVEQMAIARWRIRRFVNAETVLIDCEVVRNRDKVEKEFATLGCDVHVAMAIRSLADESRCLSLMSRYEARHQRTHDKAYAALRELQKSRASQPTPCRVSTDWVSRMVSAISRRGADPRLEIALGNINKRGNPNYLRAPRENCNLTYSVLPAWTHTLNPLCYFCYTSNT